MSAENVENLRGSLDAFNTGDKAAWLEFFDPDVVMVPAREWPENAPVRGAEPLWDFYREVTALWEAGSFELGEIIDSGPDQLVFNSRRETRGKASGAGVEFNYWTVGTYRNGRAVRLEWFSNRADALEAAGLPG